MGDGGGLGGGAITAGGLSAGAKSVGLGKRKAPTAAEPSRKPKRTPNPVSVELCGSTEILTGVL